MPCPVTLYGVGHKSGECFQRCYLDRLGIATGFTALQPGGPGHVSVAAARKQKDKFTRWVKSAAAEEMNNRSQ